MKKVLKITLIFALAAFMVSCNKFLEIKPEGETPEEEALQTPEDLQLTLNSCYDVLRSGNFMGGQGWFLPELMADHIRGEEFSGDWAAYYTRNTGIFIGATRNLWKEPYIMIYRTNVLLESFDLIEGLSDDDRNRISGEAKFLRAMGHFELVRMFGQPYGYTPDNSHLGIPLRTTASQEPLLRATVGEVYAQIVADLQDAIPLLPATNDGYATSWAAKAYLARVYFQMNDFQNAFDLVDDVVSNGGFTLVSDVNGRFEVNATSETIFDLVSTGTLDNSSGTLQGYYRGEFARPSVTMSAYVWNVFQNLDTADTRRSWFTIANEGDENEEYYLTKYDSLDFFNVPLIHLTDMMLIRAECAAELGNTATAEADLNAILNRAGAEPLPAGLNAQDLIAAARIQREVEMVSEGNRLHELKRRAVRGDVSAQQIRGADWDCPGLVVQFPDTELQANPNLTSNPQGGCQ